MPSNLSCIANRVQNEIRHVWSRRQVFLHLSYLTTTYIVIFWCTFDLYPQGLYFQQTLWVSMYVYQSCLLAYPSQPSPNACFVLKYLKNRRTCRVYFKISSRPYQCLIWFRSQCYLLTPALHSYTEDNNMQTSTDNANAEKIPRPDDIKANLTKQVPVLIYHQNVNQMRRSSDVQA